jgi:hypothetical protein
MRHPKSGLCCRRTDQHATSAISAAAEHNRDRFTDDSATLFLIQVVGTTSTALGQRCSYNATLRGQECKWVAADDAHSLQGAPIRRVENVRGGT